MRRGLWSLLLVVAVVGGCFLWPRIAGAGAGLVRGLWSPEQIVGSCLPPVSRGQGLLWPRFLLTAGKALSGVEPTQAGFLRSVLPAVLCSGKKETASVVVASPHTFSQAAPEKNASAPLVGIYSTHTGETYAPDDGVERVAGRGKVVEVAGILAEGLRRRGIRVLRSERIHDACYATSYLESAKTVREMIYAAPEIAALFDIHRDSRQPRGVATAKINGKEVARVLIVVGSDKRQPFPTWRENLAFARRIAAHAQQLYPGLCAGVRVKEGRYNQFLHPHALLVEIGGVNNTFAEAAAAAALFADVLADVLWEEYAGEDNPASS